MWQSIVWACSLLGVPCTSVPDAANIQAAYELEQTSGGTLHNRGLKVLDARCHDGAGQPVLCEVTFVSSGDPTQRLYFDIVAVARTDRGWELKSGLCKR